MAKKNSSKSTPKKKSASKKKTETSKIAQEDKQLTEEVKPETSNIEDISKENLAANLEAPPVVVSNSDSESIKFDGCKPVPSFNTLDDPKNLQPLDSPPFSSEIDEQEKEQIITNPAQSSIDTVSLPQKPAVEVPLQPEQSIVESEPTLDTDEKIKQSETFSQSIENISGIIHKSSLTESNSMGKRLLLAIACVAFLLAIVICASISNVHNYYIKSGNNGIEIWQGTFAPLGEKLYMKLPEVNIPGGVKDVYSKKEVFSLIYNYYIGKADAMSNIPGIPEFEQIKSFLNKSICYASTDEMKKKAINHINQIDTMVLIYRANILAIKGTITDLETAKNNLDKAASLYVDDIQKELIEKKRKTVNELIDKLKNTKTTSMQSKPSIKAH